MKKLIYLLIPFLFFNCANEYSVRKYFAQNEIKISELQKQRLNNYLSGQFYSFDLDRMVVINPLAFLISEDGQRSIILACESYFNNCRYSLKLNQLLKKKDKAENKNFKILALNKKTVVKNNFTKNFKNQNKYKKIKNLDNQIFADLILVPDDICDDNDC
jgi:hypothetical protein